MFFLFLPAINSVNGMEEKKERLIHQIGINDVENYSTLNYIEGDVVLIKDLGELSTNNPIRIDMASVIFCTDGTLEMVVGDIPYALHEHDMLLCPPNSIIKEIKLSDNLKNNIICLSNRFIQQIQLQLRASADIWNKFFYINNKPQLHLEECEVHIFKQYYELIDAKIQQKNHIYHKEMMLVLLQAFFYDITNSLHKYDLTEDDMLRQGNILFQKFIELLSSGFHKDRFVSDYGRKLNVTPKYLSTVCKNVSGKTASVWINEYLIEDIKYRLKYSTKSIKEIAMELDFPSISFFGKYVKAHLGVSPTDFRKQFK